LNLGIKFLLAGPTYNVAMFAVLVFVYNILGNKDINSVAFWAINIILSYD